MRPIRPTASIPATRLSRRSDLRPMVVRMISMNSLAAFTAEVSRNPAMAQARGTASGSQGQNGNTAQPQRLLDTMPAKPSGPTPRGSLLDLRV